VRERERERESSCCRDRIADAAAGGESSGRFVFIVATFLCN
jgi:hypothetical protein